MGEEAHEWFKRDTRAGVEWAAEYIVGDLRELAAAARLEGESHAQFLEGKASLLEEILKHALAQGLASPSPSPSVVKPSEAEALLSEVHEIPLPSRWLPRPWRTHLAGPITITHRNSRRPELFVGATSGSSCVSIHPHVLLNEYVLDTTGESAT